jgi:hypothetical protein
MADLYDTLTADQQAAFRAKLFPQINQSTCPSVDLTGISSADSLSDAGNRAMAIDCFQVIHSLKSAGGPGVLDQTTYNAIMGATPMSTWLLVGVLGAVAVVALTYGAHRQRRRHG